MTGFARANGCLQTAGESIDWAWEIKSVNGKNLDLKLKLPFGYDDLSFTLKSRASEFLARGNVSACLEINRDIKNRTVKIDDELLNKLAEKAIALSEKFAGKVGYPSAAELLSQKGVVEIEDDELTDDERSNLNSAVVDGFVSVCKSLLEDRKKEGYKIKVALNNILSNIENVVSEIEEVAENLPSKLKERLDLQLQQYVNDVDISEERIVQEIVLLITRADIKEEIDRLKTHIKSAHNLLESKDAVGRRLDFLCQELNREANTTCSKAADIVITNLGMELKALIEQFREQVQNIE